MRVQGLSTGLPVDSSSGKQDESLRSRSPEALFQASSRKAAKVRVLGLGYRVQEATPHASRGTRTSRVSRRDP